MEYGEQFACRPIVAGDEQQLNEGLDHDLRESGHRSGIGCEAHRWMELHAHQIDGRPRIVQIRIALASDEQDCFARASPLGGGEHDRQRGRIAAFRLCVRCLHPDRDVGIGQQ